ncbi:MAG: hypothetical protein ABSA10_06065 [Anaerolineales bacterium]|jgi:hypothetical protein
MSPYLPEILAAQFSDGSFSENLTPGNLVVPSPRRAARGRTGEILFVALDLQTRTPMPAAELDRLSALMAQVYFETPGSVTAALRAAFVAANAEVLPFSQATTPIGPMTSGMVQLHALCAILREGDIYLGFAGNVLGLLIHENNVEVYPPAGDSPSRALGTMLNVDLRYGHSSLSGTTTVILAASPVPGWSAAVPSGLANLSLNSIAERMAQQSASRPEPSGSLIIRFSPEPSPEKSASPARRLPFLPQKRDAKGAPPTASGKSQAPFILHAKTKESAEKQKAAATTASTTAPREERVDSSRANIPNRRVETPPPPERKEEPSPASQARMHSPITVAQPASKPGISPQEALSAFGHSLRVTLASAADATRSFLAGILPRGVLQENNRLSLPPAVLLGTAVAIPLLAVAVAAALYFRQGYAMEFSRLMQEARTQASVANAQTDPFKARDAWQKTFDFLKTAAQYGSSDELTTLRNHSARMLDDFDGITPLEFQPAVSGGLEADARITVLLALDRELYALDSTQDRVLRLLLGQGGYQMDDTFLCQSGDYPDIAVNSLTDIVWVPDISIGTQTPSSTHGGAVVAMDGKGTLLYCPPGGKSMAGKLVVPRTGWATPTAIDYYNGKLYVLDPQNNGLWRYGMSDNGGFDQPPSDYFSANHPSLADAVDFVVADGEVFFLHADGHVTRCQYDPLYQSADQNSTGGELCEDILFNDTRPGRTVGSQIQDALLSRIYYSEPPEPTLFFLDPLGRGAYRFSMALNFISRYRVTIAPETREATALAVGADKVLYLAVGNQIYYAQTRTP